MKLTQEQISFISWLTGMYATHAIAACFGKNHQYPSAPISLGEDASEDKARLDAQRFEAYSIGFNQQYKKEHALD
jgi:hypothetical protein